MIDTPTLVANLTATVLQLQIVIAAMESQLQAANASLHNMAISANDLSNYANQVSATDTIRTEAGNLLSAGMTTLGAVNTLYGVATSLSNLITAAKA